MRHFRDDMKDLDIKEKQLRSEQKLGFQNYRHKSQYLLDAYRNTKQWFESKQVVKCVLSFNLKCVVYRPCCSTEDFLEINCCVGCAQNQSQERQFSFIKLDCLNPYTKFHFHTFAQVSNISLCSRCSSWRIICDTELDQSKMIMTISYML